MTLEEYRVGFKAYYAANQKDYVTFPRRFLSWERWVRDLNIEKAYRSSLPEPVDFDWLRRDRAEYERSFCEYYKGFRIDGPKFVGMFSDLVSLDP